MDSDMLLIIIAAPVVVLVILFVDWFFQSDKNYVSELRVELGKSQCKFISASVPPFLSTGPFSAVSIRPFGSNSGVLFRKGYQVRYRIVKYKSADGSEHVSWAEIRIESRKVIEIVWRPSIS